MTIDLKEITLYVESWNECRVDGRNRIGVFNIAEDILLPRVLNEGFLKFRVFDGPTIPTLLIIKYV